MNFVVAYLSSAILAYIAVAAWNDRYYRVCVQGGRVPNQLLHMSGREIFIISMLWYLLVPTLVRIWLDRVDAELQAVRK
jgi:hypothetical protein